MARRDDFPSWSQVFWAVLCLTLCHLVASERTLGQSANASQGASVVASPKASPFIVAPSFSVAGSPTSAAAGDLNGDGKPDLVITKNGSNNVTVMLGSGNGQFSAGVDYPAGTQPESVQIADLNGDGRPDIVVANRSTGSVNVLFGNGDGTFAKPVQYAAVKDAVSLDLGNFSGHGNIDLAIAGASSQTIAVLRNDGSGHFSKAISYAIGHQPQSLAVTDLNGDGYADIVSGNADGTVSALLGSSTGSFRLLPSATVASAPLSGIAAGDFNGDGKADLAVTLAGSNQVNVLLGRGDGSFQPKVSYAVGNNPSSVIVADVNGHGVPDLVTTNEAGNTFSVLAGNGDGTFKPSVDFTVGNSPRGLIAGDFNGDGHTDLAILNYLDGSVSVPLGNGDGTFQAARSYKADLQRKSIVAGDLNGDGKPDLVVTNFCGSDTTCKSNGTATVFLAENDGSYRAGASYPLGNGPVGAALADVNGDGKLDLVAINQTDKSYTVVFGNGDGTFGDPLTYSLGKSPLALVVGDFNKDGKADLAITSDCGTGSCTAPGEVDILLGRGDGSFTASASYTVGYSPSSLAVGDLNGDGVPDLAVANACGEDSSCKSHGTATLLTGSAGGAFTQTNEINIGNSPSSIAIGNLGGSGVSLVVASSTGNAISVLQSDGKGGFQAPVSYPVGSAPSSLAIADFNGDGKSDVAVTNFATSTVSVLSGNGDGTLQPASTYSVGTGPESLVAVSPKKTAFASLVSANGNSGANPMGTDITVLANVVQPLVSGDPVTPTVGVTSNVANKPYGTSVTFTATVMGTSQVGTQPTGTVTFNDVTNPSNPVALNCDSQSGLTLVPVTGTFNSTGTCTLESLTGGTHLISATYNPGADKNYGTASGPTPPFMQTVTTLAPTVSITNTTNNSTSTYGDKVTFMVTVTGPSLTTSPGTVPPTGTVAYFDGANPLTCTNSGSGTLTPGTNNSTASCTVFSLTGGTHQITATYTPASTEVNYATATGPTPPFQQMVQAFTPAVSVTNTTGNPASNYGDKVTFTVTVTGVSLTNSPGTVQPTGTVAYFAGTTQLTCTNSGSGTLAQGTTNSTASCTIYALSGGTQQITATYTPATTEVNYAKATGPTPPLQQIVQPFTPTVAVINTTANPTSNYGDQVIFMVTVTGVSPTTSPGTVQPSGTVVYFDGANPLTCSNSGSGTLAQGANSSTATCTIYSLTGGPHLITATYTPASTDHNYVTASGPKPALTQNVSPIQPKQFVLTPAAGYTNQMYGTSLSFTATATGPSAPGVVAPTGTVLFSDSVSPSALNCTITLVSGGANSSAAVCSTAVLSVTSHQISGTYNAAPTDPNYKPVASSNSVPVVIVKATPSITVTNLAGSTSTFGSAVTFTATVANTSTAAGVIQPTGTVTFTDTSVVGMPNLTCTNTNPGVLTQGLTGSTATCTISMLSAITHKITATYTPATTDLNYMAAGPSSAFTQTVGQFTPTVTVAGVPNPQAYGSAIVFTATVTGASGQIQPAGTVTFNDGTTTLNCPNNTLTAAASNSTATCTISTLTGGTHQITASYVPAVNSNYAAGQPSAAFPETITKFTPTISVTNAVNPTSNYGDSVTFTATVTGVPTTGAQQPTGSVTFLDGTTTLACTNSTMLTAGTTSSTATCTISTLIGGSHQITGTYLPSSTDVNYLGAGPSTAFTQVVNKTAPTLAVVNVQNPTSTYGTLVTFTATVTGVANHVQPTGSVTFMDGTTVLNCTNSGTLTQGTASSTATCNTSALTGGTHQITISYVSGTDPDYASAGPSTPAFTQTVTPFQPAISVTNNANPISTLLDPVTFTATVTGVSATGTVQSTGTVTFQDGGTSITCMGSTDNVLTQQATNSTATCTTTALAGGVHQITAAYVPGTDRNYSAAGPSTAFQQTVKFFTIAATPTLAVITQNYPNNPNDFIQNVTVTVAATPISGFNDPLSVMSCIEVDNAGTPVASSTVTCNPTTMTNTGSGNVATLAFVATPQATIGSHIIRVTVNDANPGHLKVTNFTQFTLNVIAYTATTTVFSNAGQSTTATFMVMPQLTAPPACELFTAGHVRIPGSNDTTCNTTYTSVGLNISFTQQLPTSSVTLTITTASIVTQASVTETTRVTVALVAAPFLCLVGCLRGRRKSRRILSGLFVVILLLTALLPGIGCGSQGFTPPKVVTGAVQGSYYLEVLDSNGTTIGVVPITVTRSAL